LCSIGFFGAWIFLVLWLYVSELYIFLQEKAALATKQKEDKRKKNPSPRNRKAQEGFVCEL
jgi:uncharacterized BrkB/YihY/UPF0761 family membrane protein